MERWGCEPDYVVAIDSHPIVAEQLKGPLFSQSILITHQAIDPAVLDFWTLQKRFLRLDVGDSVVIEAMYPWLKRKISPMGCVVNSMVQIAGSLGFSPLFLVGVDFGFPDGKRRATDYRIRGAHCYESVETEIVPESEFSENGILTTREMMNYKIMLLALWRISYAEIYDCGRGILSEIPKADFGRVVDSPSFFQEGYQYPDAESINRACDSVINKYGIFIRDGKIIRPAAFFGRAARLEQELSEIQLELDRWSHGVDGKWAPK